MNFRKFYRADSPKKAAKMAYEGVDCDKEKQCLFKEIAEAKGAEWESYSGYYFYIVKEKCFEFIKSKECCAIIELPFDPLNQLNDEQIAFELKERGYNIFINKYLSCNNVIEKGVIKRSINDFDVQIILSKSTDNQLINALYERGYGKLNVFIWSYRSVGNFFAN